MADQKTRQANGKTNTKQMFPTRNDIPEDKRVQLVDLLNAQLADTFDLYSLTKQAHWNVKGPDFIQLHEFYDDLAATILPFVDLIAERAVILGGVAKGTARMAAANSRLEELPLDVHQDMDTVKALADRYATLAASTREAADKAEELEDMDTNDLFVEVSRGLDKSLWFLEAHLQ
jgi:starvation-inducible DNA-binding protein